ncbi:YggS family pyridoxal phosphate-dependent enzyme [Bacillaceae bacterium Marseille-Q3522]|nr:YggS family pyridoxal phosphate-dependent enzyme [Bacillaceae bacterium Marseille-Q3522]
MKVEKNLERIQAEIKAACTKVNRNWKEVTVIAVTKYVSSERAKEAIGAGINNLAENWDEGFLEKWEILKEQHPTWHFIGTLQTRKVKTIIDKIDFLHSLDRLSLANEIEKRSQKKVKCFIQVNVSEEASKHGLTVEQVIPFIESIRDFKKIEIVGLMTIAPFTKDENSLRYCFHTLRKLRDDVQTLALPIAPCKELSMGMSNDYVIAVEEGATMLRIGTALVGEKEQEV